MNKKLLNLYEKILKYIDKRSIPLDQNRLIPRLSDNCLFLDQSIDGVVYLYISIHFSNTNSQWIYKIFNSDSNKFEKINVATKLLKMNKKAAILEYCTKITIQDSSFLTLK